MGESLVSLIHYSWVIDNAPSDVGFCVCLWKLQLNGLAYITNTPNHPHTHREREKLRQRGGKEGERGNVCESESERVSESVRVRHCQPAIYEPSVVEWTSKAETQITQPTVSTYRTSSFYIQNNIHSIQWTEKIFSQTDSRSFRQSVSRPKARFYAKSGKHRAVFAETLYVATFHGSSMCVIDWGEGASFDVHCTPVCIVPSYSPNKPQPIMSMWASAEQPYGDTILEVHGASILQATGVSASISYRRTAPPNSACLVWA